MNQINMDDVEKSLKRTMGTRPIERKDEDPERKKRDDETPRS
jgi:hypothetical protein